MPEKRNEVVEKVDASQMMPDIYENWLRNQKNNGVRARSGFIGDEETRLGDVEDREEDKVDNTEAAHEKAKRRKRGKTSR
jgi:hypothetical protein